MRDQKAVRKYRELDRDLALLYYRLHSAGPFETEIFIPGRACTAAVREEIRSLNDRIAALDAPDDVFRLLKSHFTDFLGAQNLFLDRMSANPAPVLSWMADEMANFWEDPRDVKTREEVLLKRAGQIPELLSCLGEYASADAVRGLRNGAETLRQQYRGYADKLPEVFPNYDNAQLEELRGKLDRLDGQFVTWLNSLSDTPGLPETGRRSDGESLPQDHEGYRRELKEMLGVELDELLSWYETEIEKTRQECFSIAAGLDIPEAPVKSMREVNDILFKYEGPAASPEEMFARAEGYLKRTRAAAHACVWLPENESCEVRPIYDLYRESYPWGGYDDTGSKLGRPFKGHMFLNQYNYKNITDGWIRINTLHEAYPGHHVQWVRKINDPIPATMKIGAKGVPLSEGTCIRTERVFQTRVFSEDRFYPLFVAYRRHHGSVRIKVDLMLRLFGCTIGDAVRIYQEELGLDYATARMQVQAHENDCGYFTCYYYGLKKLEEWEKQYGYDPLEFTALLFDTGEISIENFGNFLAFSEEDKFSLTHEFASLLDFR